MKNIAKQVGEGDVCVLVNDSSEEKRTRLTKAGLALLDEKFPGISADAYEAFKKIVCDDKLKKGDLVLIDPFSQFLPKKAKVVIPQIKEANKRAAVILFALNKNPCNSVGKEFEELLKEHLRKAWRMTMPPLRYVGIKGESKYHAEVLLAASVLKNEENENDPQVAELKKRLEKLAEYLADILKIADTPAQQLEPQAVCKMK